MLKKMIGILCVSAVSACGSQAIKPEAPVLQANASQLYLSFPTEPQVLFVGQQDNQDENGNIHSMAYPGYDGITFAASILAHALVQSAVSNSAEEKAQALANQVLEDYLPLLQSMDGSQLFSDKKNFQVGDLQFSVFPSVQLKPQDVPVMVLESRPVFGLTQNHQSLILSAEFGLYPSHLPKQRKDIQVQFVSAPIQQQDVKLFWQENDYAQLRKRLNHMFHEALKLTLLDQNEHLQSAVKSSTIRYMEAGKKKVERGYVLQQGCDRVVFKTLRGAIKSAPLIHAKAQCADALAQTE